MCNVSIVDDEGRHKNLGITERESVNDILVHFGINPDTKIVYRNGKIMSRSDMAQPLPSSGMIHLSVRNKTVYRT